MRRWVSSCLRLLYAALTVTVGHAVGRRVSAAVKSAAPETTVLLLTGWGQRLVSNGDIPVHVDSVLNKPPKLRELREALALKFSP